MEGLGPQQSEHRVALPSRVVGFAGFALASVAAIAIEVMALGWAMHGSGSGGASALETVLWVLLAMLAAAGAGLAVWRLIVFGLQAAQVVVVHERGLCLRRGRRTLALPWAEIAQVYWDAGGLDVRSGTLSDVRSLWLPMPDGGAPLEISRRYTAFPVLVDALVHGTAAERLPRLRETLRSMDRNEFGPWKLSRQGIHTETAWHPWSVVGGVVLGADGTLVLRSRNSGSELGRVALSSLPDVHLLAPVIAEKVEAAAPSRRRSNPQQQGMRTFVPNRV